MAVLRDLQKLKTDLSFDLSLNRQQEPRSPQRPRLSVMRKVLYFSVSLHAASEAVRDRELGATTTPRPQGAEGKMLATWTGVSG